MALLRPRLGSYGITRLAEQTGLDVIGIPCWAAIRPNSSTLAVNQGKGMTDAAAQVSATMEAMEFCVAEAPTALKLTASIADLVSDRSSYFIPAAKLPSGLEVSPRLQLTWIQGENLATGDAVLVPLDAVALVPNAAERLPFSQSSNGLGAGLTEMEATVHALCELAERDASTLWSLRQPGHRASTAVSLENDSSDELDLLTARLRSSAMDFRLFDLTPNRGMPTIMAMVWSGEPSLYFDVASGVCSHPLARKAAVGALTEAAQTRISNISGSRDDIDPLEYAAPLPGWIKQLLHSSHSPARSLPTSLDGSAFDDWLGRTATSEELIVVPLSESADVKVVKVVSAGLEDRSTNVHWRPGARAIRAATSA